MLQSTFKALHAKTHFLLTGHLKLPMQANEQQYRMAVHLNTLALRKHITEKAAQASTTTLHVTVTCSKIFFLVMSRRKLG